VQGRLRYERYITTPFSAFAQITGLYDPFQGVTFRFNVDPGVKYLFVAKPKVKFWGEVGYDLEYDLNYTDKYGVAIDPAAVRREHRHDDALDPCVRRLPIPLQQRGRPHARPRGLARLRWIRRRLSGDPAGLHRRAGRPREAEPHAHARQLRRHPAANLGAGFAIGAGFSVKWNSAPLPGKENLDTMSTLTLIYQPGEATRSHDTPE